MLHSIGDFHRETCASFTPVDSRAYYTHRVCYSCLLKSFVTFCCCRNPAWRCNLFIRESLWSTTTQSPKFWIYYSASRNPSHLFFFSKHGFALHLRVALHHRWQWNVRTQKMKPTDLKSTKTLSSPDHHHLIRDLEKIDFTILLPGGFFFYRGLYHQPVFTANKKRGK